MYLSGVKDMHPNISEQVHDLLYHYDCVIVPELGGFVTDYHPAHIDSTLSTVHPPSKELRFNSSLKKNDGLLANALSTAKKISHEEANELLKESVEAYFTQLNQGERVVFEKVGVLYLDSHSRMRFHPFQHVNYLLDSYRLKRVFALPVQQEEEEHLEEPLPKIIPIQPMEINVEEGEHEKGAPGRRRYWVAAAFIPLVLMAGYLAMNTGAIHAVKHQVSDLFPAKVEVKRAYEARHHIPEFTDYSEDTSGISDATLTLVEADGPIPLKKEEEVAPPSMEAESTYVAPVRTAAIQFHVVGGCFSERENADKLVNSLKSQGFEAYILDTHRGLHRVVYGSFADRALALDALTAVKQEYQSDAWLLRKNPEAQ